MFKRAASLLTLLIAPASFALNNRSAVSVNGSDLNPCTVASPCRSFGAAIAQTNPGGEIVALDSAGYGPFTITGTFTVSGAPGVHAAITVPSGTGITINGAATDRVTLRNLVLIGTGAASLIQQVQAAEVRVLNCLMRGAGSGIEVDFGRLAVDHSTILDQVNNCVYGHSNGTDPVQMTIDNSLLEGGITGIYLFARSSAMVTKCTISGNVTGVYVLSNVGMAVHGMATIERSTIAYNYYGVYVYAAGMDNTARAYLAQDEISYSAVAVTISGAQGATNVYSFNNNRFTENVSNGDPLTPIAFQ